MDSVNADVELAGTKVIASRIEVKAANHEVDPVTAEVEAARSKVVPARFEVEAANQK